MKEVKTVQDVEIIVKKIIENREAEKKDILERIKENDQNLIDANKEKDKAESEGNEEYYLKIREKINELDNLKDMYESRLEKINEKALINTKGLQHVIPLFGGKKESYFIFSKTSDIPHYNALLIYYRYLDRMSWCDVASKLNKKSLSTVHSLHRKTLDLLDI